MRKKPRLIADDDDGCCCCARCCKQCAIPRQYMCMYPDIVREYCRLRQRYCDSITKKERLWALARPKSCKKYCKPECECTRDLIRDVKISYVDKSVHTRTEQLAYPMASTLLELKKRPSFVGFPLQRKSVVNRTLRKSLLSVYSRLANTEPPKKPEKKPKWTAAQWEQHMKYIGNLAKVDNKVSEEELIASSPKKTLGPKAYASMKGFYEETKKTGASQMRRIKKLARPKIYKEQPENIWHLTQSMREFTPSERLLQMSKPKPRLEPLIYGTREIRPETLEYTASDRIRELAAHKQFSRLESLRKNPFRVRPGALQGNASERVIQLATPRQVVDTHTRLEPEKVSRKALRARMTPRLNELAKPKQYLT